MRGTAQGSLHIAINAHLLSGRAWYRSAGIHQYIHYLLRHLEQADEELRYTVLLGDGALPADVSLTPLHSRWLTSRAAVRILWEQLAQPWVLSRIEADLAHAPAFVSPLLSSCPAVITIHDLSFFRYPDLFRAANRLYLKTFTRLSARRARRLIAVSAYTATETARLLGIPQERIDVIYHGVDPVFRPLPADEVAAFRQHHGLPRRFVLFVGTLEPRKNLVGLVEAFARVYEGDTKLVLAGGRGWLYDELFAKVEELELRDGVVFPGYVTNEELPLWYNAATFLVYPSLYEGFGLPVIESQACGTPTLTSNTSSLPEAAGDAAMLVDPCDVDALAAGLRRLLVDASLRDELRERGLAHARRFTWPHTAQETARTYRRALSQGEDV